MKEVVDQVTIVISFRERWGVTENTINSLLDNTPNQVRIILLDSGMPQTLRDSIEDSQCVVIKRVPNNNPNLGRKLISAEITTDYAVFIDNDVIVSENWLEELLNTAKKHNAGIVAPLYLIGSLEPSDTIHMAGGEFTPYPIDSKIGLIESHRRANKKLQDNLQTLIEEKCDYAEYHCMLVKREVFSLKDFFHNQINTVHEHIHASLIALRHGYSTWFSPNSKVQYAAFHSFTLGDLPAFRRRWALGEANQSILGFCDYWGVNDTTESYGAIRHFVFRHLTEIDCLHPKLPESIRTEKFRKEDLHQTPSELLLGASGRGYSLEENQLIWEAIKVAMIISNGIFRPCGRPLFNHLIGTASILIFYGFNLRVIILALLHTGYSHFNQPNDEIFIQQQTFRIKQFGDSIQKLVQNYPQKGSIYSTVDISGIHKMKLSDLDILVVDAANEIDMHLSNEVSLTQRNDVLDEAQLSLLKIILNSIGCTGMGLSLDELSLYRSAPLKINFELPGSFRFEGDAIKSAIKI